MNDITDPPESAQAFSPAGDASALKSRSAAGAAITMGAQGAKFVLQFGSQVALARMLLPADFGLIAMVAPLVAAALLLTDLGLSAATIQRPTIDQAQLSSLFWLNVAIGGALVAGTLILAPFVARFYATSALFWIVIAMASSLLLSSLAAQHLALLNRRMQFGAIAGIEFGSLVISTIIGVTAAFTGFGYWSLVMMQIGNGAVVMAAAWGLSGWRPSRPRIEPDTFQMIRFGGAITGYNLLGYLITNLDNILIGARFGAGPLGFYDRAYKLMFQPLWQMTAPAARVAVPLLSRLADADREYRNTYITMLGLILTITTPGILVAILFADQVIGLLLGGRWLAAAPIFAWLGVCALTLQLRQAASWLFVSQGRAGEQLRWGGLGSLSIIGAYLIGIHWGPLGVAIGAAIASGLVQIPLMWWAVTRRGPVSGRDALALFGPLAAATAVTAAMLAMLARQPMWGPFVSIALALVLGYAAFLVALTPFPAGRALLRRAAGFAQRLR